MKRTIQGILLAGSLVVGGAALAQSAPQPTGVNRGSQGVNPGSQGVNPGSQGVNRGSQGMPQGGMQGEAMKGSQPGKAVAKGGMIEHLGFMVPADEKAMLERLHHVNQEEIKLGKLAQQNSQNPDVKAYGEMLVKDHTAADQKLMSYAQQKNLKLAEPKPLNDMERKAMAAHKANGEKLQGLKGMSFDSCFLASMVGGHDDVLGKLRAAQENVADVVLAPMLQELSQSVSQHRQQAYTLLGRVGPGSSAGTGGSGQMVEGLIPDSEIGRMDADKNTQSPGAANRMDPGNPKRF